MVRFARRCGGCILRPIIGHYVKRSQSCVAPAQSRGFRRSRRVLYCYSDDDEHAELVECRRLSGACPSSATFAERRREVRACGCVCASVASPFRERRSSEVDCSRGRGWQFYAIRVELCSVYAKKLRRVNNARIFAAMITTETITVTERSSGKTRIEVSVTDDLIFAVKAGKGLRLEWTTVTERGAVAAILPKSRRSRAQAKRT